MKYSNTLDAIIFQTLYLKLILVLGIYLSNGVALMVKSMHDFYGEMFQYKITDI